MINEKIKIITTGRLAAEFQNELAEFADAENFEIRHVEKIDQEILNNCNAVAAFSVPAELNISHIKWIHSFGAGVDAFVNRTDLNSDVIITRTVGSLGEKIAEYCLAHVLAYKQNIYEAYESQRANEWKQRTPDELKQSKIAVIGTGNMGHAVAKLFITLGAEVTGINRDGHSVDDFSQCYPFDQVISTDRHNPVVTGVDTLISILPDAPGTKEILTLNFFSQFQAVHFINVGRGRVVKEETILAAIEKGYVSRATLDVFAFEPLPASSGLWKNERIFITPHQASLTGINDVLESFHSVYKALKENKHNPLFVDTGKGY